MASDAGGIGTVPDVLLGPKEVEKYFKSTYITVQVQTDQVASVNTSFLLKEYSGTLLLKYPPPSLNMFRQASNRTSPWVRKFLSLNADYGKR